MSLKESEVIHIYHFLLMILITKELILNLLNSNQMETNRIKENKSRSAVLPAGKTNQDYNQQKPNPEDPNQTENSQGIERDDVNVHHEPALNINRQANIQKRVAKQDDESSDRSPGNSLDNYIDKDELDSGKDHTDNIKF